VLVPLFFGLFAARGRTGVAAGEDAGAGVASADPEAFEAATALEDAGQVAEAVRAFVALADRSPTSPFADDALAEAARLREEKLTDPQGALALYERLVREYPDSRLALRASRRAEALRAGMGEAAAHVAALAAWNDVLQGYSGRPRAESMARAERILIDHVGFPLAPRIALWLGEQAAEAGDLGTALAWFRQVPGRWPESPEALRARRAEGDTLVRLGRLDDAERVFASLAGEGDNLAAMALAESVAELRAARRWARAEIGAWLLIGGFLVLVVVTVWRRAGSLRGLARPPFEWIYAAPVIVLLAVAAQTEHAAIGWALLAIGGAALVVIWLCGAALEAIARRAGRVSAGWALGLGGGASLAALAASFLTVRHLGLTELVIHTLQYGADR
jgi:tetratricopeptide (TPR) repeat protein